jgi:hypothetical protein
MKMPLVVKPLRLERESLRRLQTALTQATRRMVLLSPVALGALAGCDTQPCTGLPNVCG